MAPRHLLNQWWLLINHTPMNKLWWRNHRNQTTVTGETIVKCVGVWQWHSRWTQYPCLCGEYSTRTDIQFQKSTDKLHLKLPSILLPFCPGRHEFSHHLALSLHHNRHSCYNCSAAHSYYLMFSSYSVCYLSISPLPRSHPLRSCHLRRSPLSRCPQAPVCALPWSVASAAAPPSTWTPETGWTGTAWYPGSPGNQDNHQINGSGQDCSISIALAMEILQSCTKPLRYYNYRNRMDGNIKHHSIG